jgi:N,N'-diacetylchitobiose transport system permease protein
MSTVDTVERPTVARPPTPPRRPTGARRRRSARQLAGRIGVNALGALVLVTTLFPIYWMLNTAFKPANESLTLTPVFFPTNPTLDNFRDAIGRQYFWSDVRNSVLVVVAVVLLSSVLAFLAAVAVARFEFRGRKAFLVLIIAVQMVPLNAMIIPIYLMLNSVGLTDRLPGLVLTYLTFVLPFTVWTLRGFVVNVPVELEEAAMIDGLSRTGAFVRVLFPLVAPGLVATAVFAFIQAWNEYVLAYVLMSSPENQTITVWLASFTTSRGTSWGPLMAASTLTALPVVVFFVLVQRRIVAGMTAGAVKG